MLEARNSASTALLALKPRQVLLVEHNTNTRKMQNKILKPQHKALLLHSVVRYLQKNGYSKTLKRFLSEAQIENDNWKASSLDLEDLYCKYLDKRSHADPKFNMYKEQELRADGTTEKEGNSYCAASEETIKKKKKKRSDESDSSAVEDQSEATDKSLIETAKKSEVLANDMGPESNVKSKGNKKGKKSSNSPGQIEQVKSGALEKHVDDTMCELQMDKSSKKDDKKKMKSKLAFESLLEVTEEKSKDLSFPVGDIGTDYKAEAKPKDKKKTKSSTDSLVENVDHCGLADKQGMITDNLVSGSVLGNTLDLVLEEKIVKSKDTKGKKVGLVYERLSCGFVEVLDEETPIIVDSINECFRSSEETTKNNKKSSKKRKRLASDENECQPVKKEATEESKCRKVEGLEEVKNRNRLKKGDLGKESKQGNGQVGQNGPQKPSKKQLVVDANVNEDLEKNGREKTSINQLNGHANGNLEKNEGDKFAVQKTTRKQHNGSAEPKQVNAFQRVKIDDVVFADEKLQDNSYWAKDGAEVGYGAKAQEILGQVRGRDFRHEKTKKKRGSYRGGQIDLHSHSIKFNYSEEE